MFSQDVAVYRSDFERAGYVHLRQVLTDDFVAYLRETAAAISAGLIDDLARNHIPGHKRQYLFDFPDDHAVEQFRVGLSALGGLDASKATLSERHVMIYEPTSPPIPWPHKDRCASGLTVGFPIHVPEGSDIFLFPTLDRSENPNEKATYLGERGTEGADYFYERSDAVRITHEIGDMVAFAGSTIYHSRVRPAGTIMLYCKMNDVGRDPLGENIFGRQLALVD